MIYVKLQISMYVLCPVSDAEILMTLWEDYALQLDDVIEKNHFKREPLVLMLTLAKIKDATGEYNVFFFYFLRLPINIMWHCILFHVPIMFFFCRQVSPQCPKYKKWFQVVCKLR